jgi:hypothetical protein
MNEFWAAFTTGIGLIAIVAIVGELVSRNAQTPAVIQAGASGLANNFAVALSPVTGASYQPSLGYPSQGHFGTSFAT